MKALLVPVEQSTSPGVLQTALAVARVFDSYVEGIASAPSLPDVIITDVGILAGNLPNLNPDKRREVARAARQQFEAWMTAQGRPAPPGRAARALLWLARG